MPLYELIDIVHAYNGHTALSIDRWRIDGGGIVGLFGPNGSGKSTLLKLLAFVNRPTNGRILLNGRETRPFDPDARETVVLLPQQTFLLKRSVYRNVAYGLRLRKTPEIIDQRVREAMALVGLDYDRFYRRPWFALSGGEAHRVSLAARLALHPKVLLLDEPTTSVDAASAQHIKSAALHAHRQWGSTIVISSHEIGWLQEICHETHYLFQGKLLGQGHRTLLFGPWQPLDEQLVYMTLDNDQRFVAVAPSPRAPQPVAAIAADHLQIHAGPDTIPADMQQARGTLTSMRLERASSQINVNVRVGQTVFSASIPAHHFTNGNFMPGGTVWIAYDPADTQWC